MLVFVRTTCLLMTALVAAHFSATAQLFGGQIKAKPPVPSPYPAGSVFCASGPTAIIDVTNPFTGKVWMDRNLGASQVATSSTDAAAFGDLYQWGRRSDGHQCRNSNLTTMLSTIDQPTHGDFIVSTTTPYDWRSPQNTNLWQGANGVNNPCPNGYRLPTDVELDAERASWAPQNNLGAFGSPLKLTMGGARNYLDGLIYSAATNGGYWSSTVDGTDSKYVSFDNLNAYMSVDGRASGNSVRCVKDLAVGAVGALNCGSANTSGTLTQGTASSGVSTSVPYTGGNGGTYSSQSVASTGVTGLTATLSVGILASGSGSVVYTITGTPASSGTASFAISLGGQSCTFTISVQSALVAQYPTGSTFCAAGPTAIVDVTNPTTGKTWMDRNLGASRAATSSTDAQAYGDLYQWGRGPDGHQCRNSTTTTTLSSTDQPAHGSFIRSTGDWRSPQNPYLWLSYSGVNNPCPNNYRLPTESELEAERLSWTTNNTSGAFGSPLKLTMGGYRDFSTASISSAGTYGYYWNSNFVANLSSFMYFYNSGAVSNTASRGFGFSVRCIKDGNASVTAINCGSAVTTGTVTQSSPAVNVSITVPYTGGNGGTYSAQTIVSTGVLGLFANLSSGTLANGSGSLTFTISGTAIGSGTANFTVRMGAQSCTFSINVIALVNRYTPGATFCANGPTPIYEVTNANTGKVWMDRNLGASRPANSETDAQSFGDLYQWGRNIDGHQCRNSTLTSTLSSTDQPANGSFITTSSGNYDWRSPQNDNLWQGVNGINNPCPSGFRLPTDAEFNAERLSWSVNNSLGSFGAAVKISLAGYRNFFTGTVTGAGTDGYFWTSSINSTNANMMYIGLQNAALQSYQRSFGLSVRCIKN
jgi:uncharacterized protein (TIGR02145 family)